MPPSVDAITAMRRRSRSTSSRGRARARCRGPARRRGAAPSARRGPVWCVTSCMPRILLGDRRRLRGAALDDLDAAALAAAAGVDLRLDDDAPGFFGLGDEALGDGPDLFHRERRLALGHGHAVPGEDLLGLILVDFHEGAGPYHAPTSRPNPLSSRPSSPPRRPPPGGLIRAVAEHVRAPRGRAHPEGRCCQRAAVDLLAEGEVLLEHALERRGKGRVPEIAFTSRFWRSDWASRLDDPRSPSGRRRRRSCVEHAARPLVSRTPARPGGDSVDRSRGVEHGPDVGGARDHDAHVDAAPGGVAEVAEEAERREEVGVGDPDALAAPRGWRRGTRSGCSCARGVLAAHITETSGSGAAAVADVADLVEGRAARAPPRGAEEVLELARSRAVEGICVSRHAAPPSSTGA